MVVASIEEAKYRRIKMFEVFPLSILMVSLVIAIGVLGSSSSPLSDDAFSACFIALLVLIAVLQLRVGLILFLNRHNPLIELFQPTGLMWFALAGAIAILSCVAVAFPTSDASCAIQRHIILICISYMGSILVARTWRISCILSPALSFASSPSSSKNGLGVARLRCMSALSSISQWLNAAANCRIGRRVSPGGNTNSMRKQITVADSTRLVWVLMLPQIILQIILLSVPTTKVRSNEIANDVYVCQSSVNDVGLLMAGIILAAAPFLLALLLNIKSDKALDKFREFDSIASSMKISIHVLAITLPTYAMIGPTVPTARAYLFASSVISVIFPVCHNIAWSKVCLLRCTDEAKQAVAKRLTQNTSVTSSLSHRDNSIHDSSVILEQLEEASATANMFEAMGKTEKALGIKRDALSLFKSHGEFQWEEGFTSSEAMIFGPKELSFVVGTMAECAQTLLNSNFEHAELSTKICSNALQVFEDCPAKALLKDRSAIFPCYSMLSHYSRKGFILVNAQDDHMKVEGDFISRFLKETVFMQYHHLRALAWKVDFLAKNSDFEGAVAVIENMKAMYDPELHNKALTGTYKMDQCAAKISLGILLHHYLGNNEEVQSSMKYVLESILPFIPKDNYLDLMANLIPVVMVSKDLGHAEARRARDLFKEYVAIPVSANKGKVHYVVELIWRPFFVYANAASGEVYDSLSDDVEWLLEGNKSQLPEWNERRSSSNSFFVSTRGRSSYSGLNLALHDFMADSCVGLVKIIDVQGSEELLQKREGLLQEGFKLSKYVETIWQNDHTFVPLKAKEFHDNIISELQGLSDPI